MSKRGSVVCVTVWDEGGGSDREGEASTRGYVDF